MGEIASRLVMANKRHIANNPFYDAAFKPFTPACACHGVLITSEKDARLTQTGTFLYLPDFYTVSLRDAYQDKILANGKRNNFVFSTKIGLQICFIDYDAKSALTSRFLLLNFLGSIPIF